MVTDETQWNMQEDPEELKVAITKCKNSRIWSVQITEAGSGKERRYEGNEKYEKIDKRKSKTVEEKKIV